ncbi:hypothetical protein [Sphingomonas bacterium]|uniref:hypothetical protein n=1 Tax=Sphingomonas bacterium TaxID=1895847 RepID=UPI0015774EC7|nr:hypothetical protein [Sphingomonas bacterium]
MTSFFLAVPALATVYGPADSIRLAKGSRVARPGRFGASPAGYLRASMSCSTARWSSDRSRSRSPAVPITSRWQHEVDVTLASQFVSADRRARQPSDAMRVGGGFAPRIIQVLPPNDGI